MVRMQPVASTTGSAGTDVLLERADELSTLADRLQQVEHDRRGQVVLLGGGGGAGRTSPLGGGGGRGKRSLLRRFRGERAGSTRVLTGGCAPLFTPRPLGPLLA